VESLAIFVIEVPRGFVGEENGGAGSQGTGHRGALLFATTELRGTVMETLGEPHPREELAGMRIGFCDGPPANPERKAHIFERREFAKEVVELKDEPNTPVPYLRQRLVTLPVNRSAINADFASRWRVEGSQDVQQRALPGTALADDRDHLPAIHGEIDAL
jgi:hypothetical protein